MSEGFIVPSVGTAGIVGDPLLVMTVGNSVVNEEEESVGEEESVENEEESVGYVVGSRVTSVGIEGTEEDSVGEKKGFSDVEEELEGNTVVIPEGVLDGGVGIEFPSTKHTS
uniref:Zinc finger X-chromosomal protein n=1 Tax=Lygus hesperus TaxID=30085 RepID=A0A0A9XEB2_LYGHE